MLLREPAPAVLDGQRLDRVVALMTERSRAVAANLLDSGAVTVDGSVVRQASTRVRLGQEITIDLPETDARIMPRPDSSIEFRVVYVDDEVIVIDKPEGLVVHPGSGHLVRTLVNGLLARFPELAGVGDPSRPGIVHRLDKGTSGLMMVARSELAYEELVSQLAGHSAGREYLALVLGIPETRAGVIDAPLGRSPRDPTRIAVVTSGKPARTHYEVEQTFTDPEPLALLRLRLETGRTHQIRAHLFAIEHPVIGDPVYKGRRRLTKPPRPMLHAARLSFAHPATGEPMSFGSPIPADMQAVLDSLSTPD